MPTEQTTLLGFTFDEWAAIGIWVTVVVYLVLALYAGRQLRESRLSRIEQSRPYVVAEFTTRGDEGALLQITNIGATPAYNLRLKLAEEWVPAADTDARWQHGQAFSEGLPLMPPGHSLRYFLDLMDARHKRDDLPTTLKLHLDYRSAAGAPYAEDQTIDLAVYMEALMHDKGMHALVSEVTSLRKSVQKWTAPGNKGLAVYASDADLDTERRIQRSKVMRAQLREQKEATADSSSTSPNRRFPRLRHWAISRLEE